MQTRQSLAQLLLSAATFCTLCLGCSAPLQSTAAPAAPSPAARETQQLSDEGGTVCSIIDDKSRVSDTRIAERWPEKNYGHIKASFAGSIAEASRQALLRFDLGNLPEGIEVTRATVSLHKAVGTGTGVTAHRVMAAWSENEVTWSSFAQAYDAEPIAELPPGDGEPSTVSFDITKLVQAWADHESPNHGILLRQDNSNTAFATSEADDASDRPRLLVCYRERESGAEVEVAQAR